MSHNRYKNKKKHRNKSSQHSNMKWKLNKPKIHQKIGLADLHPPSNKSDDANVQEEDKLSKNKQTNF